MSDQEKCICDDLRNIPHRHSDGRIVKPARLAKEDWADEYLRMAKKWDWLLDDKDKMTPFAVRATVSFMREKFRDHDKKILAFLDEKIRSHSKAIGALEDRSMGNPTYRWHSGNKNALVDLREFLKAI